MDNLRPVIVVADDDRDICELIKMQLTRHGFDVYIADDGEAALELVNEYHPAVALLDIMMPKLSGLEVARRIREDPMTSTISIMLASARSSGRIEADLEDLDIADYITKPFSPQDLVKRINDVIKPSAQVENGTTKPQTGKAKIIVADDDLDICDLLGMKLRQTGYEVFTAMDGAQAIEMIRSVHPALVILDIMMPLKSGMDVLREMKLEPAIADIPVILMTAKRQEKDVNSGFALGVVDYIVKPFNLRDLVIQVEKVIAGE